MYSKLLLTLNLHRLGRAACTLVHTSSDENLLLKVAWYFVVLEAMFTPLGHATAQHTQRTHQSGGGQEAELNTTQCGGLCGREGRVALRARL